MHVLTLCAVVLTGVMACSLVRAVRVDLTDEVADQLLSDMIFADAMTPSKLFSYDGTFHVFYPLHPRSGKELSRFEIPSTMEF